MKKIKMAQAIGLADEKYVAEAAPAANVTKSVFWRKFAIIAACVSLLITSVSLWLFMPFRQSETADVAIPAELSGYADSEYLDLLRAFYDLDTSRYGFDEPENNYERYVEDVLASILSFGNKGGTNRDDFLYYGDAEVKYDGVIYPVDEAVDSINGNYVETTDNQVKGVIEGDLMKRTRTHIFYLDPVELVIRVYSIAGEASDLVATYDLNEGKGEEYIHSYAIQTFLSEDGNTLTVIGNRNDVGIYYNTDEYEYYPALVRVISLDVSDPASITEKSSFAITGNLVTTRFVDGRILLMSEFNAYGKDYSDIDALIPRIDTGDGWEKIPAESIILPDEISSKTYTIVTQLDADDLDCDGAIACIGYSRDIYVSSDKIVLCREFYDKTDRTELFVIGYGEGGFVRLGSAAVDGSVKDQYSLDEYEGVLRVVTTTRGTAFTNAALYCIDLSSFEIIGEVRDFAPDGETVESVRFDGTNAYVCTAVVVTFTDPVYFFDLSDMSNITYTDTGVIEGYSSSLVDLGGGFLLGIGYGADRTTLKIEVYAENGNAVESVANYTLECAEFSADYKSYFIDRERGLVGLMVNRYTKTNCSEYLLLQFNGYTLTAVDSVKFGVYLSPDYARAALADGYLYVACQGEFEAVKLFD